MTRQVEALRNFGPAEQRAGLHELRATTCYAGQAPNARCSACPWATRTVAAETALSLWGTGRDSLWKPGARCLFRGFPPIRRLSYILCFVRTGIRGRPRLEMNDP